MALMNFLCFLSVQPCTRIQYAADDGEAAVSTEEINSLFREAKNFRRMAENSHENIIKFKFLCTSTDSTEVFIGLEYFEG